VLLLGALERWGEARRALDEWRRSGLARSPEELALVEQALEAGGACLPYFAARLGDGAEARCALTSLLDTESGRAPALDALLDAMVREARTPRPEDVALAARFAEESPATPRLAAGHLLAMGRSLARAGKWRESESAFLRVLAIAGCAPLQRLEAEDGVGRARHAIEVVLPRLAALGVARGLNKDAPGADALPSTARASARAR
jgi:hypothetical protein